MSKKTTPDSESFESKMKTLETLIATLESGDVGLDESLALYEKGVALLKDCRQTIADAELKMEALLRGGSTPTLAPLPSARTE